MSSWAPARPATPMPEGGMLEGLAGIFAELKVGIGQLGHRIDKTRSQQGALNAPVFATFAKAGAANTSGIVILGLGKPEKGFFWYVRSIRVSGATPSTSAPGRADVFVMAANPGTQSTVTDLTPLGAADWRDQATSLPLVGSYGRGELPLNEGEHLFIVFSAATSGQQYNASATVEQFQWGAIREEWAI